MAVAMTGERVGIMDRLKRATAELHNLAERHPLQQTLVRGALPRRTYTSYLRQMLAIHTTLEIELRRRGDVPALAAVVREEHFQAPRLREDLAFYGEASAAGEPLPAVAAWCEALPERSAADPLFALGCHYVLEGSNNGGRFIARAVRQAYELPHGRGDRFLDPYGDKQPALWRQFKQDMESVGFTDEEQAVLEDAASEMFRFFSVMMDELWARQSAAPAAQIP